MLMTTVVFKLSAVADSIAALVCQLGRKYAKIFWNTNRLKSNQTKAAAAAAAAA